MMKKLLIAAFAAVSAFSAQAANGDTTWVQSHTEKWLDHYGAHDTTIQFPDGSKSYRRIYMIWTLGKRVCPGYDPNNAGDGAGQTGWCGDWDYDVHNILMTKGGDTIELSRLITPYARENAPRTPLTWKERYTFDVTDYYNLLKDSATFRIFYSGYSWGFTANVKFAFVEGTPARNVLGVVKPWSGGYSFGNPANQPIDNYITQKTYTAPANTQFAELKVNVTGHGADDNGCCEFASKYYEVKLNSSAIAKTDMWRDDCGSNHLYPQTGTWIYDRASWCPGDVVFPYVYKLSGVTANNSYNIDLDFEPYTGSVTSGGSWGSYKVEGNIVYYGAYNRTKDASLEDIIAPSNHEKHFRENPCSGKPTVEVMNTGSSVITSMRFEYWVGNGSVSYYNWTGTLNPMEKKQITFDEIWGVRDASGDNTFTAKIAEVNGSADEDATNNQLTSYFKAAPKWPSVVRVNFRTNGAPETSWKIYDALNNVVVQRNGTATNTTYEDTVRLGPGAYQFVVEDGSCNGLYWPWSSAGTGNIRIFAATGLTTYTLGGLFSGNFGCGFTQEFTVAWPTDVVNVNEVKTAMDVYPNPAINQITVTLDGKTPNGTINLIDMTGRVVASQVANSFETKINTAALANGVYYVTYTSNDSEVKLNTKLVIAK